MAYDNQEQNDRYMLWSFRRPTRGGRYLKPHEWETRWRFAPISPCGTFYQLHVHETCYPTREAAEAAAVAMTGEV